MGPIAVPASQLPKVLKVTTKVNGELRQEATTEDLIFSIPTLIKTLSESQTLRAGDVIATGTPAGVGFGLKPPQFLKAGDLVEISVSGLGVLRNKVAAADTTNAVTQRISSETSLPVSNLSRTSGGLGLTTLASGKQLDIRKTGSGNHLVVFIHGLGGDKSFYTSEITISSLAADLHDIMTLPSLALSSHRTTIVAHSMGCLVATLFASLHPDLVQRLILLGPPPIPVPAGGVNASVARAAKVRSEGMREVTAAVSTAATSEKTKAERPLAFAAVQMSLLSQDPEGYAKGCTALASGGTLDADLPSKLDQQEVLVIAGEEDKVSPKAWAEKLSGTLLKNGKLTVLPDVGHWHCFEDVDGVARAIKDVLV
ncbi:uncharacterized protein AB675_6172 [Cyphellophora attinorum]|uniref:Uncharacterized protein n=1 Tax=Cyphellophora attinorum TaxID=1664694 RepID=A0A0N1H983_9EURO|nr:uncharacterized protein AB675_6172 [Phialophora attinorum]KPI43993.1 hypothetical protein AB675_6172 [Phialophora attinorum]